MSALLTNETRSAQNRFEEQANKLGALDTLLKEERLRQQKEREHLLGIDGLGDGSSSTKKRSNIPSAHFNSVTPVVGMRMSLSSILAHGPKPLRGAEALLARSKKERAKEESLRKVHMQLEQRLRMQDGHRLGAAPTSNMFVLNSGLDTDFLPGGETNRGGLPEGLENIPESLRAVKRSVFTTSERLVGV